MPAHLQLLGTDTADSTPSVLLFFDRARYLFNAGEGTQRLCTEHGIRMTKIQNVFLTRLSPDAVGGLPGKLLV